VTGWLLVTLAWLAVFRLAWLITHDFIAAPLRARVQARSEWWDVFITCPWCVSVWVGAVVAPVVIWWGDNRVVLAGLLALAASAVTGIIAELVNLIEQIAGSIEDDRG